MKHHTKIKIKDKKLAIILIILIIAPILLFSSSNPGMSSYLQVVSSPNKHFKKILPSLTIWRSNIKKKHGLKFGNDETFKIVQFSDIQDGPNIDVRTINLMNKVLDYEKPELVVVTGDNIDGRCKSVKDVKLAILNISKPMETREILWAVVFGNHDEEHNVLSKEEMLKLYMSYPHNISLSGPKDVDGVGNYNLPIKDCRDEKTIFNLYMLDSGSYASGPVEGYSWVKPSQIDWYRKTSLELRGKYNMVIPSLMFFHIPLPEIKQIWKSGKAVGYRNESEDCPIVNSGLFSSLLEMGDVLGVFFGHDHTNDYMGELYGIKLGYSRNIGYGTYGKIGFSRGARVFSIKQSDTSHFKTWLRLASDFS